MLLITEMVVLVGGVSLKLLMANDAAWSRCKHALLVACDFVRDGGIRRTINRMDPIAREKHERLMDNRCVRCGYSLEANVSGICPECGFLHGRPGAAEPFADGWKTGDGAGTQREAEQEKVGK